MKKNNNKSNQINLTPLEIELKPIELDLPPLDMTPLPAIKLEPLSPLCTPEELQIALGGLFAKHDSRIRSEKIKAGIARKKNAKKDASIVKNSKV